jgi:hypothetical protein
MKYALSMLLLAPLWIGLLTGCDADPIRPTLSNAFAKFNPQRRFIAVGCDVEHGPSEGRVNSREVYGWRPFQGTIELPADAGGCDFVVKAVRDALLEVAPGPCQDELTLMDNRGAGQPMYGVLRYASEGTRGVVYVWLFPDKAEKRINYAILLHEEHPQKES